MIAQPFRFPSLETRWLQRTWKTMPQVPVVLVSDDIGIAAQGFFEFPERGEIFVGSRPFDTSRGLIVILEKYSAELKSTLAHEWRHIWQCHRFGNGFYDWPRVPKRLFLNPDTYERAIVSYFRGSRAEMDAFRFEYKHAPTDVTRLWMDYLYGQPNKCSRES